MSVNASTDPEPEMDASNKQPSLMETVNAMSDVQLHRYNAATLQLMRQTVTEWARELSTPQRPVTPHLMELSFRDIHQPERRRFLNRVPTSFALSEEQVDRLIEAGREILRNDPAFQRLMADLRGERPQARSPASSN